MSLRALLDARLLPVLLVAAIVIILPLFFPSAYYYRIGALVFIFALAVVGLNLLMGFAGQVSLGHAGFLGIGAYSVAIGPAHFGAPSWLCLFAGALLSGMVAFAVGRPILKLKGHYLAVATLGFGLLIAIVLNNEAGWTGGPDGMSVPALQAFRLARARIRRLVLDRRRDIRRRVSARAQSDGKPDRPRAAGHP